MEHIFKNILAGSMAEHGWPAQVTDEEAYKLEYGTETMSPAPAVRRAVPKMQNAIAEEILASLDKALA